jgi:transcriptional regulator with XRE-family HTH domain
LDNLLFIANYEAILKERKIKKGDFYAACSITDAAVSQWRKNKNHPAMKTINRIAEYLNVSVYSLIGEDTKKEPVPISENELDLRLVELLTSLTPDEMRQVDAFVQGLLASR